MTTANRIAVAIAVAFVIAEWFVTAAPAEATWRLIGDPFEWIRNWW